jgi:hypothetical protein
MQSPKGELNCFIVCRTIWLICRIFGDLNLIWLLNRVDCRKAGNKKCRPFCVWKSVWKMRTRFFICHRVLLYRFPYAKGKVDFINLTATLFSDMNEIRYVPIGIEEKKRPSHRGFLKTLKRFIRSLLFRVRKPHSCAMAKAEEDIIIF